MGGVSKEKVDNRTRGEKNIDWIQDHCRVPDGPNVGKKVKLREWQRAWIKLIYDNPAGTRVAILSVGRKNAKTTFSAFLLLLHLCGREMRHNSQLYSTAQSREQAAVIFGLAAKIIRLSSTLRGVVLIRDTRKELFCPQLGTLYRALTAEPKTAYGLSPSFVVHDELGQVKGPRSELYEAMETATGAQNDPLSIIISTQAPTDNDLLSQLIDSAIEGDDPRVVCSLYSAPNDAEPFVEDTIRKANPAFGDFLNKVEVMAMAAAASRMPSREADYRNLVLNQRVEQSNPFIAKSEWQACGAEPVKDFDALTSFAGLDLSASNDLTAFVRIAKKGDVWSVVPDFWLPEEGLRERSRLDRVPYDMWERQGFLKTTPGKAISYDFVATYLRELTGKTRIERIAFDRWHFPEFKAALIRVGFSEKEIEKLFVEFGQGYQSMAPALLKLEKLILTSKLAHGNHPVLAMCARNATVTRDSQNNRKLDKMRSNGRIDGMVALTMAAAIADNAGDKAKEFQVMVF